MVAAGLSQPLPKALDNSEQSLLPVPTIPRQMQRTIICERSFILPLVLVWAWCGFKFVAFHRCCRFTSTSAARTTRRGHLRATHIHGLLANISTTEVRTTVLLLFFMYQRFLVDAAVDACLSSSTEIATGTYRGPHSTVFYTLSYVVISSTSSLGQ